MLTVSSGGRRSVIGENPRRSAMMNRDCRGARHRAFSPRGRLQAAPRPQSSLRSSVPECLTDGLFAHTRAACVRSSTRFRELRIVELARFLSDTADQAVAGASRPHSYAFPLVNTQRSGGQPVARVAAGFSTFPWVSRMGMAH
jgi:hypothetical protein